MSGGPVVENWVQNELVFLCQENICVSIYLITSFIDGYIQHLNVIFESENKHGRIVVVIPFKWKKKRSGLGPILPTFWILWVVSLTLRDINKLSFCSKFERFVSKNGRQTSVEELSFKSIVVLTIAESYRYFKIK